MKKHFLLISFAVVVANTGLAQETDAYIGIKTVVNTAKKHTYGDNNRNITCSSDTLRYSLLKETSYPTADTFVLNQFIRGPRRAWAQNFYLNSTISIHGVEFYGRVQDRTNPSQVITVKAYLYDLNANMPFNRIDSATVDVDTGLRYYTAIFPSPLSWSTNYAVAIHNPLSTDSLIIVLNNGKSTTFGEGLGHTRYSNGTWQKAVTFTNQDLEPLISPIVGYALKTDFTSPAILGGSCLGQPVTFTNTTIPSDVNSRMYSLSAFKARWTSAPDSTYTWDMDDGSPVIVDTNATHNFAAAGTYNLKLTTSTGLYNSCIDSKTYPVTIADTSIASFTYDNTLDPTISFTYTSTGAATYLWDFGDSSPTDNTQNPSHTYAAPGTYAVVLVTIDAGFCSYDTAYALITIISTGISENQQSKLIVFPNPSTGNFSITGIAKNSLIEVYNVIGERVYSQSDATAQINVRDLRKGIYLLKVISEDGSITNHMIVTE